MNMLRTFLKFTLAISIHFFISAEKDLVISAKEHSKMRLCIVTLPYKNIQEIAEIVKQDLSWSKQFDVDLLVRDNLYSRLEIKSLSALGYPLIIFLSYGKHNSLEWRIYDSSQFIMIEGKRIKENHVNDRGAAHHCSDGIWYALTGESSCFLSKIIYCQEKRVSGIARAYKYLYLADYDGSQARLLVSSPTVSLAPRWNSSSSDTPLIYYSECTPRNLRLMAVNMSGKRRAVSNFAGLNMSVAWSPDGKSAVLCLSRDGTTQLYLYHVSDENESKRPLEKLTDAGLNVSPCFINNSELLFCSDNNSASKPYLSVMNLHDRLITTLVKGYCSSPSYCAKTDKIAYSRRVNSNLQLFLYDRKSKTERQLTQDSGNKDTCSWSPCGNYFLYTFDDGVHSRIAVYHVKTDRHWFITSERVRCSYPAWSPNCSLYFE
ncbi:MAG TPA: hypothetical protein VJ201_04980 [Candidatus Babeliales bacterium]|nr:hypothetical protein [Candidatus Babeliales bacterium]